MFQSKLIAWAEGFWNESVSSKIIQKVSQENVKVAVLAAQSDRTYFKKIILVRRKESYQRRSHCDILQIYWAAKFQT